jgi:hypothetical protein
MKNALNFLLTFGVSWQSEGASPLHLDNPRHSKAPNTDPAFPSNLVEEVRETVELRLRYQLRMAGKAKVRSLKCATDWVFKPHVAVLHALVKW